MPISGVAFSKFLNNKVATQIQFIYQCSISKKKFHVCNVISKKKKNRNEINLFEFKENLRTTPGRLCSKPLRNIVFVCAGH